MNATAVLDNIKTRRVVRDMTGQPVEQEKLAQILEAGRWAPAGGNQRTVRFVAIQEPATVRLLRLVSPGMLPRPAAVILLCLDQTALVQVAGGLTDYVHELDVGAAMQNMMLAAHALGLGSGPVTSFSQTAVGIILNLPDHLLPRVIICIGYQGIGRQVAMKARQRVTWQSLTHWERFDAS